MLQQVLVLMHYPWLWDALKRNVFSLDGKDGKGLLLLPLFLSLSLFVTVSHFPSISLSLPPSPLPFPHYLTIIRQYIQSYIYIIDCASGRSLCCRHCHSNHSPLTLVAAGDVGFTEVPLCRTCCVCARPPS